LGKRNVTPEDEADEAIAALLGPWAWPACGPFDKPAVRRPGNARRLGAMSMVSETV